MQNPNEKENQVESTFPATVAEVIDNYRVVINRGTLHGIKLGQRFLLYTLSEKEIIDPISKKPLGYLEIVKGTGKVTHVQESMSTIESDKTEQVGGKTVKTKQPSSQWPSIWPPSKDVVIEEITTPSIRLVPFDSPSIEDKAKPI